MEKEFDFEKYIWQIQFRPRFMFPENRSFCATVDYLNRHPEMDARLSRSGNTRFLTTDTAKFFEKGAFLFGMQDISAESLTL